MTDSHLFAWAAGIIDGEGHVCATKRGGMRIVVSNTDMEILVRLQRIFGGGIYVKGRKGTRTRPDQDKSRWVPCHQWQLYRNEDCRAALDAVWPWLGSAKRAQAEVALAQSRPARRVDHDEIRRLRADGLTYQQISERLECSIGTAHRAVNPD